MFHLYLHFLHLSRRAGISHFTTELEIPPTLPPAICYGFHWVLSLREHRGCQSVLAKY